MFSGFELNLNDINWWLWCSLIPVYYLYEYIGTKNTIATSRLKAISASNTGVMMYIIGVLGTYICVTEGLINLIPIVIGAWFGTYYSVNAEIKIVKRKKAEKINGRKNINRTGEKSRCSSTIWPGQVRSSLCGSVRSDIQEVPGQAS